MKLRFAFFFLIIPVLILLSCSPQNKLPKNYLNNVSDTTGNNIWSSYEPRIQKNDELYIRVYSLTTNPNTDAPYNLPPITSGAGEASAMQGFLVDSKGNINYPRIGTIHVEGLTKDELADIIKSRFQNELEQPTVIIRFMNFRVTVLGEVNRPGTYQIPSERVTILEALGLAGDIPITGLKESVTVSREIDGKRIIGEIDLTSRELFESPFYMLNQNDVVFVEPTRQRLKQQSDQVNMQRLSLALSIITSIALVYNIIR